MTELGKHISLWQQPSQGLGVRAMPHKLVHPRERGRGGGGGGQREGGKGNGGGKARGRGKRKR